MNICLFGNYDFFASLFSKDATEKFFKSFYRWRFWVFLGYDKLSWRKDMNCFHFQEAGCDVALIIFIQEDFIHNIFCKLVCLVQKINFFHEMASTLWSILNAEMGIFYFLHDTRRILNRNCLLTMKPIRSSFTDVLKDNSESF